MRKKWKRLMDELMDMDADRILEKVNSDPSLKDVKAPEEIHDKLMQQIRKYEEDQAKELSEEEKELIRLGKKYKKNKKKNKALILLVAALVVLGVGMTSMGGPKRVYEKVQGMIGGKEQLNAEGNERQIDAIRSVSEVEAYEQVEEEFGFYPVRLDYLPDKMIFTEAAIEKQTQNAQLFYEKGEEKILLYTILPNYRTTTVGTDIEDSIIDEYEKEVKDIKVQIKEIAVEDDQTTRWRAEFQYLDVQYFLLMSGFTEQEMEKTIENLYFLK